MRRHRGTLMSSLSGGIGDVHLVFHWSVMSKYLPSFLAKFSPLCLPMPLQLPLTSAKKNLLTTALQCLIMPY